ncbi:hypothetical protein KIL84_000019 [Mauremys mutica]|uniref:Uncharacterized protein n=1 Tax=Mauremys mutica TaxID=74926 RepID=A0A9D3XG12_9SAUR|nr:hypothetical protein KIL84_000019 [Mauremys mutica]
MQGTGTTPMFPETSILHRLTHIRTLSDSAEASGAVCSTQNYAHVSVFARLRWKGFSQIEMVGSSCASPLHRGEFHPVALQQQRRISFSYEAWSWKMGWFCFTRRVHMLILLAGLLLKLEIYCTVWKRKKTNKKILMFQNK